MFLQKIEIQGFKSFPDKMEFEIAPGIASIVSPKDSEKRDVLDAIKWALGEQSLKALGVNHSDELIFAGSENKKPKGCAEVKLTIDNTDYTLPDMPGEVSIIRRAYRYNGNEYKINYFDCRLKDLQGLFANTGIGKYGYAIIQPVEVDKVIKGTLNYRKQIIQKACGVMGYKIKLEDIEKQFAKTEQDIARINTIIREIKERSDKDGEQFSQEESISIKSRIDFLEEVNKDRGQAREAQSNDIKNFAARINNQILEKAHIINDSFKNTYEDLTAGKIHEMPLEPAILNWNRMFIKSKCVEERSYLLLSFYIALLQANKKQFCIIEDTDGPDYLKMSLVRKYLEETCVANQVILVE